MSNRPWGWRGFVYQVAVEEEVEEEDTRGDEYEWQMTLTPQLSDGLAAGTAKVVIASEPMGTIPSSKCYDIVYKTASMLRE